jgi:hypothetical protein
VLDFKTGKRRRERRGPAAREAEILRELLLRLEIRSAEAGELRARLELPERAEPSLREDLEREWQKADRLEGELKEARQGSGDDCLVGETGTASGS